MAVDPTGGFGRSRHRGAVSGSERRIGRPVMFGGRVDLYRVLILDSRNGSRRFGASGCQVPKQDARTGSRGRIGVAVASERSANDEETGGTPVRSRH